MKKKKDYSVKDIVDLSDKDHTRKRPALIFGQETGDEDNPYSSMKLTALREISDNAVGEISQGYADTVKVEIYKDYSFSILDNGRGLPVDIGKTSNGKKVSGIYKSMAMAKSGGNLGTDMLEGFTTSLNGVGAASTIFMSEYAIVEAYRNNKIYSLHFYDGDPGFFKDKNNPTKDTFTPIGKDWSKLLIEKDNRSKKEKKEFKTGTKVTIKLKDSLFPSKYQYSKEDFKERMRGTASLLKGAKIIIIDEEENTTEEYIYQNGLVDLLALAQAKEPINNPIIISDEVEYTENDRTKKTKYELAFSWVNNYDYYIESYVNTIRTRLGGVHEVAFQRSLLKIFNEKFRSMRGMLNKSDIDPNFDDYAEGLSVVINAYVQEPSFSGQAKEELSGKELQKALINSISEQLESYVNSSKNADDLKEIGTKVITATRNRARAREERELKRQKSALRNNTTMPSKLIDCEITHEPMSELVICEGDSAMGSIKASRDSTYQAAIPIRGKILNTLKGSKTKIWANKEIQDITKALDCGIGEDCNVDNARYQMVSIAADADPDGQAICCLIYALFWTIFPDYIKKGRLFKITTPLFIIKIGNKTYPAFTNEEKDQIVKKYGQNKKVEIKRAKGLGELTADEMSHYGMDRETRVITQIVMDDVEKAEEMLEITLGTDVSLRKKWIEDNPQDTIEE